MMSTIRLYAVLIIACVLGDVAYCQDNRIPSTGTNNFYMDRSGDCNGPIREVGDSTVMVWGVSSEYQSRGVTSCTLTLSTENVRQQKRFKIQLIAINIKDQGVNFGIYDGENGGGILGLYHKDHNKPTNLDFVFTTGQFVTFRLTRDLEDKSYDIRLTVEPILSDVVRCTYENEYGCDDGEFGSGYGRLETKEIVGIIAGGLGLVFIIVIIVVFYCYCHQTGVTQKWKEDRLGHVNTAASIYSINGKVVNESRSNKPWTSESSKNGFASIRRSPNLPRAKIMRTKRSDDGDSSIYESNASLPSKRHIPPPQVRNGPQSYRSDRDRRDYRDRDRDHDRDSDRSYSTDRTDKFYKPPTYREALRNDSDSELGEATMHSFVQADDDHPQKTFVERVIVPRVKPKGSVPQSRAPPPPEDDETYDSIEPKTKASKALMAEADDETEESDTDNESNESTESEDEELEEDSEEIDDPADQVDKVEYSKPNKRGKMNGPQPQPQQYPGQGQPRHMMPPHGAFVAVPQGQFPGMPYPPPLPPGVHQPQPRYGYPPPVPIPTYHQGQPAPPPQPGAYHQANFTVPLQPQGGPVAQSFPAQPQQHQLRPANHTSRRRDKPPAEITAGNPPMYSYLVNRGYQPMDGRYSPVSVSTGASNLSGDRNLQGDDTDFSANLDSGVELMRRKTDV